MSEGTRICDARSVRLVVRRGVDLVEWLRGDLIHASTVKTRRGTAGLDVSQLRRSLPEARTTTVRVAWSPAGGSVCRVCFTALVTAVFSNPYRPGMVGFTFPGCLTEAGLALPTATSATEPWSAFLATSQQGTMIEDLRERGVE